MNLNDSMEAVALLALTGIGYVVTRLAGSKQTDSFQNNAQRGPATSPLQQAPRGGSASGPNQELDAMYNDLMSGPAPPGNPVPGIQGSLLNYVAPRPQTMSSNPAGPEPLDSSTADVALNPAGIEESPTYVDGSQISSLTGKRVSAAEFTHNNMTPFFGGSVKQNVGAQANTGILDSYTGSGINQIKKKEVETMFDTAKAPYGNPYGLESATDFVQSRINDPRNRSGERPFEPVRVAPGVEGGFSSTGNGGFQQLEVNETMIKNIRRTDDLRTADNPKLTYKQPVVPGQHFIGAAAQNSGEVRKYRPDKFYVDESGKRFGAAGAESFQKETTRSIQVLKHTTRPETSAEVMGPAASQEYGESYVTGSYRTPMAQQYGGAGYRNADMTTYTSSDTDAPEADYGRSGYEVRPNERAATSERTMALNLVPADTGNVTVHYDDPSRPTRRAETVGNIRQTGTPVGYAGGAPAVTVWDPNDVARTTVKEGTISWDWFGQAGPGSAPTRMKVYDPEDIAKPTQKAQISAKSEYYGGSISVNKDFTSHDAAYNMRSNPNKEQIAAGRAPLHGNGGAVAVFDGNVNQTTKKLNADSVNDRTSAINRVVGLPTGVGDIGAVRYRVPLKMDVSRVRNGPETVAAVNANPLMASQNLMANANHDDELYQQWLAEVKA